ncbi:PAS domain-containing protein [Ulvibacterium sp.]|uniref:PAS domain-containing protein n=1 Tax=Ulvibacterium sp. TaxID=2665914 RepID=UPI002605DA00|nr:PAS domain-containing protein [Ulvibacterium sp.]
MKENKKGYLSPIQSLDFYLQNYRTLCKKLRLDRDLVELRDVLKRDVDTSIVKVLQDSSYEALVVTDVEKKIIWTNKGFPEMTGYPKSFAIGKSPTFLQGRNTSLETKKEIRKLLKQQKRFSRTLINYRKNGEAYLCCIDVLPLFNSRREVTHFLAMEKEQMAA